MEILEQVYTRLEPVAYQPGETIFEKGEVCDSMYFIVEGRAGVHDGKSYLTTLRESEFFGEMALINQVPRTARVSAQTELDLLRLDRDDFQELLEANIPLLETIIQALALRLHDRYIELETIHTQLQQIILPLGIALSSERDPDRLLERILLETKRLCNADAGTIYQRTGDDQLRFSIMFTDSLGIAQGGTSGKQIPFKPLPLYEEDTGLPNDDNVATYVALHGETVNIPDIYNDDCFDFSGALAFDQITGYRSVSNLTLPLKDHNGEVIGVMQLFNAQDPETGEVIPFNDFQRLVAESLTSQAAVSLNTQMLLRRQQELVKFERDLQVGRQIQSDFLPSDIPQPEGWEIAARFEPAREVAGDFYDVFSLSDNKIAIVVADVCDKGVGAALFMALSRSLIRSFNWLNHLDEGGENLENSLDLNSVCQTNSYIVENHISMNMFVTMFYGILDTSNHTFTYISAGHNPPAVIGKDGEVKARLTPTGPAVGIMGDMDFNEVTISLEPGDLLFAFTDGVPDARSESGAFFKEDRMLPIITDQPNTAQDTVDAVLRAIHEHVGDAARFDDVTIAAVRRMPTD